MTENKFINHKSPGLLLFIITISLFIGEALIMTFLHYFPEIPSEIRVLIDPLLLVLLVSPILYFFLFRPLITHIEERKRTEEVLMKEKDRMHKYLDIAGVMLLVLDKEGRVILINRRGREIIGYGEEEIIGRDWFENFLPVRIKEKMRSVFEALLKGETKGIEYFENPVLTKDGYERIILWHNRLLTENGKIIGTLSSGEDITERKRTEEALKESETRYRQIHDTAFDAIIVSDSLDRVVDCNPSAEHMFGYNKGELIGLEIPKLMPEKYRVEHKAGIKRFLESGRSNIQGKILEVEGLRKNGEAFPMELVLNSFTLGGAINFTGMMRDITERKNAEREKELIQVRLSQAQKMEAIGRFAGGIAHDFNNILTGIRGNAELLIEEAGKSDPTYPRLNEIILSVLHASKLTKQLLLFSRGQPFEMTPVNVNRIIENLLVMVTRLIGEDITVSTSLSPDLWQVKADESGIEQVVMNLAVNARDAMPHGGTLTIGTENYIVSEEESKAIPEAKPGRVVAISVEDTGIGMSRELVQHIFEPFFTTKDGKGTGFGLTVVYGIVKQHEGWVTVQSEPGKGTAFRVFLPALHIKQEDEQGTQRHGMKNKVLLVQDEERLREFTKRALAANGYEVLEAASAKEAMDIFAKEGGEIDLLFSNYALPDRSGDELAEYCQSKKTELPVLLTGIFPRARGSFADRGYSYLQKPYSLSDLLRAVKSAKTRKKMKR